MLESRSLLEVWLGNTELENRWQRVRCRMLLMGIWCVGSAVTLRMSLLPCRKFLKGDVKRPALHIQRERHLLKTRRIVSRTRGLVSVLDLPDNRQLTFDPSHTAAEWVA
jgi:hypothetical protein